MGFYFTINSMSWESKGTPLFTDKALFLLGGKRGQRFHQAFPGCFGGLEHLDWSLPSWLKDSPHTVDGSEIRQAPVEGKVVYPMIYHGFSTIPGGWEWDFTSPSTVCHGNLRVPPSLLIRPYFFWGGRGMVAGPAFSSSFSRLLRWPGTSGLESTQLVEGFTAYC